MLKNKNAIISGSNRGIGKAILKIFAENGANVFALSRTPNEEFEKFCECLSEKNDISIKNIYFDITDTELMKKKVKEIFEITTNIDVLVNNAGEIYGELFSMTPRNMLEKQMDINFFSHIRLSQYIVKKMLKHKKGSIINISSVSGLDHHIGRMAYDASKAAIISATSVMAKELGSAGIRVNTVAPGVTDTDLMRENIRIEDIEKTLNHTCLKRIGAPEDVAKAVLFLASDLSDYITGQTLRVDGGLYIRE